jgi:hypothetical protein
VLVHVVPRREHVPVDLGHVQGVVGHRVPFRQ